jgi:pyrroloquinoline quinone (PQQ) biosynthesis protein C
MLSHTSVHPFIKAMVGGENKIRYYVDEHAYKKSSFIFELSL